MGAIGHREPSLSLTLSDDVELTRKAMYFAHRGLQTFRGWLGGFSSPATQFGGSAGIGAEEAQPGRGSCSPAVPFFATALQRYHGRSASSSSRRPASSAERSNWEFSSPDALPVRAEKSHVDYPPYPTAPMGWTPDVPYCLSFLIGVDNNKFGFVAVAIGQPIAPGVGR